MSATSIAQLLSNEVFSILIKQKESSEQYVLITLEGSSMRHVRYFEEKKQLDGEQLLALLSGWIEPRKKGALILTSERIVFIRKGLLGEVFEAIRASLQSSSAS